MQYYAAMVTLFTYYCRRAKALVNKVVEDAGGATSMPVSCLSATNMTVHKHKSSYLWKF